MPCLDVTAGDITDDRNGAFLVADAVGFEPVSTPKFPANREINREFFIFGLDRGTEVAIRPTIQKA